MVVLADRSPLEAWVRAMVNRRGGGPAPNTRRILIVGLAMQNLTIKAPCNDHLCPRSYLLIR